MGNEHTGGSICLQSCDDPRLGNLKWTTVFHVDGREKQDIALLCDSRGHSLHDVAIDWLLIIGHQVLIQKFLDLIRREPCKGSDGKLESAGERNDTHPTDILDYLNVAQRSLLELQ